MTDDVLEPADLLFVHSRQLLPLTDGAARGPRLGSALESVHVIEDGAVAVRDGLVAAVGTTEEIRRRFRAQKEIDLDGMVVVPGFVDTHSRAVLHAPCSSEDSPAVEQAFAAQLDRFLVHGTTTLEVKCQLEAGDSSGTLALDVVDSVASEHTLQVHRTVLVERGLLSGVAVSAAVAGFVERVLPSLSGRVDSCGVSGRGAEALDVEAAQRLFGAVRSLGMGVRLDVGGRDTVGDAEADLAVRVGARSADRLIGVGRAGIAALGAHPETTATLLPGVGFAPGGDGYPPARELLRAGAALALATGFGADAAASTWSLPMVVFLACTQMHMTPAECLYAVTINPAASLGLDDSVGSLHPGKRCDLAVLDLPGWNSIARAYGGNPVVMTVKDGRPAVLNTHDFDPGL